MLFPAGPGIDSRACILVRNTIQAFPLLELCSRDVVMVRLSFNGGRSIRDLTVTSEYLPYDSNHPHRGNYRMLSTIAVGTTYSSLLDVMPMHTTLYGGALASILEDAVYWNIW